LLWCAWPPDSAGPRPLRFSHRHIEGDPATVARTLAAALTLSTAA
jgi:hypothetical protein